MTTEEADDDENKDIATEKTPPWYRYEGWDRAVINFDDLSTGVSVILADCSSKAGHEITKTVKVEGNRLILDEKAISALCEGHVAEVKGEGEGLARIFPMPLPAANSKPEKWSSWCLGLKEKVAGRLVRGVLLFRRDAGAAVQGNE